MAIYALRRIYTKKGWNVLEISKGEDEAKDLLLKSKIVYENLPDWMKTFTLEPNSKEQFGFKELKSKITALSTTQTSGIGVTAGDVIHDESDFHEFYEVNLSHTRATVADSPERHLISVSTVDKTKPDSYFKRHWRDAEAGKNGFKALFYGYDARPDRDEEFYNAMVRENENTPWVVEGNYPRSVEEALSPLAATSCFNKDVLKKLWDEAVEVEQGFIYTFCPPRVGVHYTAGVDVGEGLGLDYSVLSIVGKDGLMSELAAVIYINTLGTAEFAWEVDRLCRKYFNPPLVVDNIGVGRAVVDKLVELGYPNLYSQEAEEKKRKGSQITGTEKVGFALSQPNKRVLVFKLVENIDNGSLIIKWKPMIKEMMEYQLINGYPEPTGKTHGDTVIALMLANQMLKKVGTSFKPSYFVEGRKIF